jgi:hypothetical protein
MIAAVNHLQQSIPQGDLILVDMQSGFPIMYYLCGRQEILPTITVRGPFNQFSCNGYSIVSSPAWKLAAQNFSLQFEKMARTYGLKSGDRVWVFQSGWGDNLDTDLPSHLPQFRCLTPKSFGANLSVIPFVVAPDSDRSLIHVPWGLVLARNLRRCYKITPLSRLGIACRWGVCLRSSEVT